VDEGERDKRKGDREGSDRSEKSMSETYLAGDSPGEKRKSIGIDT